ncbi:hypothetical protein ES703_84809 [subsurface metagenome]
MPDYFGTSIDLTEGEEVRVNLLKTDGQDSVKIVEVKIDNE